MNMLEQQWKERERSKKREINNYIGDLKKQMEQTKKKKEEEYIWEHMKTLNTPFI